MSKKRDYTKYSKEVSEPVDMTLTEIVREMEKEEVVAEPEVKMVEEPVVEVVEQAEAEPEKQEEPIVGIVTDCVKLNVRETPHPKGLIVAAIDASTELVIFEDESTEDFYKICTSAGLEGYCMKRFITIMP